MLHTQIEIRWFQGGKGNIPVFLQSCGGNTKVNGWIWPEGGVGCCACPLIYVTWQHWLQVEPGDRVPLTASHTPAFEGNKTGASRSIKCQGIFATTSIRSISRQLILTFFPIVNRPNPSIADKLPCAVNPLIYRSASEDLDERYQHSTLTSLQLSYAVIRVRWFRGTMSLYYVVRVKFVYLGQRMEF